ncbi:MAG: hypothetical protein ACI39F_00090 [Acutalibacteraceae bacterium]
MDTNKTWDTFYNTGRIDDYLKFKNSTDTKEHSSFEPYNDKRIDNKGTEGRRI